MRHHDTPPPQATPSPSQAFPQSMVLIYLSASRPTLPNPHQRKGAVAGEVGIVVGRRVCVPVGPTLGALMSLSSTSPPPPSRGKWHRHPLHLLPMAVDDMNDTNTGLVVTVFDIPFLFFSWLWMAQMALKQIIQYSEETRKEGSFTPCQCPPLVVACVSDGIGNVPDR